MPQQIGKGMVLAIDESLKGRRAIVTGAGRGMGRSVAGALAERGARVAVNDLDGEAAERTAALLRSAGAESAAIQADVTDAGGVGRMVDRVLKDFGGVDILVNNAGILRPTRVQEISEAEWDLVIEVNLKGTFLCSQAVLPSMRG